MVKLDLFEKVGIYTKIQERSANNERVCRIDEKALGKLYFSI